MNPLCKTLRDSEWRVQVEGTEGDMAFICSLALCLQSLPDSSEIEGHSAPQTAWAGQRFREEKHKPQAMAEQSKAIGRSPGSDIAISQLALQGHSQNGREVAPATP